MRTLRLLALPVLLCLAGCTTPTAPAPSGPLPDPSDYRMETALRREGVNYILDLQVYQKTQLGIEMLLFAPQMILTPERPGELLIDQGADTFVCTAHLQRDSADISAKIKATLKRGAQVIRSFNENAPLME